MNAPVDVVEREPKTGVVHDRTVRRVVRLMELLHTGPVPETDLRRAIVDEGLAEATRAQSAVNVNLHWLKDRGFVVVERDARNANVWRSVGQKAPPSIGDIRATFMRERKAAQTLGVETLRRRRATSPPTSSTLAPSTASSTNATTFVKKNVRARRALPLPRAA